MFFDPMYFLFILPGLGLSLWASERMKRAFNPRSSNSAARRRRSSKLCSSSPTLS